MKAYIQLTIAQLKLFIRNKQALFFTLLFPVFFMVIFGALMNTGKGLSVDTAIMDADRTPASQQLVESLKKSGVLDITTYEDKELATGDLKNGDMQLVIVIPQGYEKTMDAVTKQPSGSTATAPEGAKLQVLYDETNTNAQAGIMAVNGVIDGISKSLAHFVPVISIQTEGVQGLNLKYMDFLVPGIVAMMIMSNNLNGVAGQISSWRERGVLRRMQSTTLRASTFIGAQITARLILNALQAIILILIGSLAFGAQINGSWWLLILFIVLGTLAFMSIGFIIAGVAKTPESAGPIAGFISFPLMFLGGVFFPIKSMPEFLQPIVKAIPISHLSTGLRQVMNVGANFSMVWSEALTLGIWMVVAFIVASFTFKWE
ncbi:ABC transporter permease [Paenibacillus sp. N1-5-1-14]|uniref:ABC transporter permease n=1 Tax=Paenibacillus radicibacter TaxID=2972488 RepID=UPI0021591A1F|nr:ABC transporter permease [Paenibacillus radicibacter]MCR8645630.1 ABC transporter permease [Paenibacillus radicibacter]